MTYSLLLFGLGFLVGAVLTAILGAAREYEARIGGGARGGHRESTARRAG